MSLFYLSDTTILFSSCVCKTTNLSRYHLPREWLHDNVDVGIAESTSAFVVSKVPKARREGRERCADIRTPSEVLLSKSDSVWDVGAFRTRKR